MSSRIAKRSAVSRGGISGWNIVFLVVGGLGGGHAEHAKANGGDSHRLADSPGSTMAVRMATSRTSASVAPRGRGDEIAQLDGLLDGALAGPSGGLVLRGEAGVGKSELLKYAIASASTSALRVVHVAGIESEMELGFAGLHQVCEPMLDRLPAIPDPQREALQIAFGLTTEPAPDRFLVGLAVLSLLSEVAQECPVLCVIDDAQWLDDASAQALAFVARSMLAEPVVLLVAARESSDAFTGAPQLALEGLGHADALAVLVSVLP